MRFEVYSHALVQRYRTSLVTKAVFFQLILFILLIVAPLLIAYRTSGFWIKEKYYTESPYVYYRHEAIVYVDTGSRTLVWTTYPNLNQFLSMEGVLNTPLIQSIEVDNDFNGKNDYMDFSSTFTLNSGETVNSVNAYLFFDYELRLFSRVRALGLALIQEQSDSGASKLAVTGDLNFFQKINLPHKGDNTDFANELIIDQSSSFDLNAYVQSYNARNLTTELVHSFRRWQMGASADNTFVLELRVRYPEQTLRYEPGFLEEIKFAWIQYLSIFVIFLFAFDRLKTFVFQNQVFPTVPMHTQMRKKL